MTINSTNLLYRWAFIFYEDNQKPVHFNLCSFFWHIVLFAPLLGLVIIATGPVWVPIYYIIKFKKYLKQAHPSWFEEKEPKPTPLWMMALESKFGDAKDKVCPIITVKENDVQETQRGTQ